MDMRFRIRPGSTARAFRRFRSRIVASITDPGRDRDGGSGIASQATQAPTTYA